MYSTRTDSIFCFCCVLFDGKRTKLSTPDSGYKDWNHVHSDLASHENTSNHKISFESWKKLRNRNTCASTIDSYQTRMLQNETEHWKQIFFRIVVAIKYLAGPSLAFRGTTEKLYEHNNGNFLKLIESFAEFDATMRAHMQKFLEGKSRNHYLSHDIQNEIIGIIAKSIRSVIITMAKQSVYFAVIADTTSDLSHKEQFSIVLRFVYFDTETKTFKIAEHFLSFVEVVSTTGRALSEVILNELRNHGLDLNFLRGTGFDNGPNMAGGNIGAQKIILNEFPRALFIPCSNHTLNLFVNDVAKFSQEIQSFFNVVQDFFKYFSASPKRWALLQTHAQSSKGIVLKNLSDTRLSSRAAAMKCLNESLPQIYDALIEISESSDFEEKSKFNATQLGHRIFKFKFVLSTVIWNEFLSRINVVSKVLQSKSMDFSSCSGHLKKLREYFQAVRLNSTYDSLYSKAEGIASQMNIPVDFATCDAIRNLRSLRYRNEDDEHVDLKAKFKADFFYYIIDIALKSLDERFEKYEFLTQYFGFLSDISKPCQAEDCHQLAKLLTATDKHTTEELKDIISDDLFNEIQSFNQVSPVNDLGPLAILNSMALYSTLEIYPNLVTASKILLTLPVSVASGEGSFSKLKLIKTYLRSTMQQERLSGLSVISIEKNLLDQVHVDEIATKFAKMKVRRHSF